MNAPRRRVVPLTVLRGARKPGRTALVSFLSRGLVVLTGSACVLVAALPDPTRPVLVAAGLAVAATATAAVTAWRLAGTVALGLTTLTLLLAAVLDVSDLRPVQVVSAGVLLLAMVSALDRAETMSGPAPVTVLRAALHRLLGPLALAVAAGVVVASTAARTVVPSVGLVLAGLAAAVTALVLATRAHRG